MKTLPLLKKQLSWFPINSINEFELVHDKIRDRLLLFVFNRPPTSASMSLIIYDVSNPQIPLLLASMSFPITFGTVMQTPDGVYHCYGATLPPGPGNALMHVALDCNLVPSVPDVIFSPPASMGIDYNNCAVSASESPDGFVLGFDYYQGGANVSAWFKGPTPQLPYPASAVVMGYRSIPPWNNCMTTDYVDGLYRVTSGVLVTGSGGTLGFNGSYTTIGTTCDFKTFRQFSGNAKWPSGTQFLANDYSVESIVSDPTRPTEYNGKVYVGYFDGDQDTCAATHLATYDGTLSQFYAEFA